MKKKKVWVGYAVMRGQEILTEASSGQLAIYSNFDVALRSTPYNLSEGLIIVKLYMRMQKI